MFTEKRAMFLYCVSPVHMGAGTALGAIDNPIQRERHTQHPMMAGSGIKGALRHEARGLWGDNGFVSRIFGPDPKEHGDDGRAGAVSFADAQIVLFPVRSLRQSYVYATCPTALARLRRVLAIAGGTDLDGWGELSVERDEAIFTNDSLKTSSGGTDWLVLEAFRFQRRQDSSGTLASVAAWLAENALPPDPSFAYFREKVKNDTVVLADDRFNYFVRNATVVEPHVRIDDATGTASDGGLFYTESLPPESLLMSLAMASRERSRNGGMEADDVIARVVAGGEGAEGFAGRMVQFGGDATTGRGQVVLSFAGGA